MRSVKDAWPHSSLAIFSVAVSVMPGSQILTPQVSSTTWAPSLPHRVRSCVVDLAGHGREQRGDRAVVVLGLGYQVQGSAPVKECLDVEAAGVIWQRGPGQGRIGHERQGAGDDHPDRLRRLLRLAPQLGQF